MQPTRENNEKTPPPSTSSSGARQIFLGALLGIAFGFLLQKGGVAKYHVLMGVLLFQDFTVIQVMLTAVIVGMLGVYTMHYFGLVNLYLKPTQYASNILGGLIFGVGFGLAGYCPGTQAAALGQGNGDAALVILGMLAGSYFYAEMSGFLNKTVNSWGNRGNLTLPQLFSVAPYPLFVLIFAALLAGFLGILEWWK